MRFHKKNQKKVIAFLLVLAALILIVLLGTANNCKEDKECFDNSAARCARAMATLEKEGNILNYEIEGKKDDSCLIDVKLIRLSEGQSVSMRQALEGRDMKCSIPLEILQNKSIVEIENTNDYCTGPLKEATLEITLEKMYEIIVKNIGPITIGLS